MKENFLFYAIIGLLITAIMAYLSKATEKEVKANEDGIIHLRMHKLYNIVGYLSLVLCLIITIASFATSEQDLELYLMVFFLFALFGGLGLLSVLYYRNHYLSFDNSKIVVRSVFGKTKTIAWENIQKASFNSMSGLLTIKDNQGIDIKIHQHLVGLKKFVALIEDKTKWSSKELKIPGTLNNDV